jgi:hypothetical protein
MRTTSGPRGLITTFSSPCSNSHCATGPLVGRRRSGGHALGARADRHRDHVLLQLFLVANAGIEAGGKHVDEAVFGRDLERDVGIGVQEARHDRRQHQARSGQRHVQAQGAARTPVRIVHGGERGLHFVERRRHPRQQGAAGVGRHDAARAAVQQAQAEPLFQAAHRLADAGGAQARHARRFAKAAGTGHGHEQAEVVQIVGHRFMLIVRFFVQPVRTIPDCHAWVHSVSCPHTNSLRKTT